MLKALHILGLLLFGTVLSGQSIATYEQDSMAYEKAIGLVRKTLTFIALNDKDSIQSSFEEALAFSLEKGYEDIIPIIYIEKAHLAGLGNDALEAQQFLDKAKPYLEKDSLHPYLDDYYASLAQLNFMLKKYEKALFYNAQAEQVRKRVAPFRNWKTYNFYFLIYKEMGQIKLARQYRQRAEKLARLQNVTKTITEIENNFLLGGKTEKINELILQNQVINLQKEIAHKQKRSLVIGLILISILLILMVIVGYQRGKNNRALLEKNEIIANNLVEKEALVKEIHHRVKNNLQLISSLLSLQSRSVQDKKAFEALSESQNRVISMALIHQNLYKEHTQPILDVKDYITQLTDRLTQVYHLHLEKIAVNIEVDSIALDVATLVPLGLILNELVTNAFKHGFDKEKGGVLEVSLKEIDHTLVLRVKDNGKGGIDQQEKRGFGMRLVRTLATKLEGELHWYEAQGTCVELSMKNYKPMSLNQKDQS